MNDKLNDQNEEMTVDEEIAKMRESFKEARFGGYPGMESTRFKKRASTVFLACVRDVENGEKKFEESEISTKAYQSFYPHLQDMYELHENTVQQRLDKANKEMAVELKKNDAKLGRMASRVRKSIDAKFDAELRRTLTAEEKQIKAMEDSYKRYIQNAPQGSTVKLNSYSEMFRQNVKDNKESLSLAAQYLNASATRKKYEEYEKNGVITEGEKRIYAIAKELEEAAKLRLENFKDFAHLRQQKFIMERIPSPAMGEMASKLAREDFDLALIAMPKEDPQVLLNRRLDKSEEKYYGALKAKRELKGFHPFKKIALNIEIKKAADEYNRSLARFNKDKEEKDKRPPLTTLEEKERRDNEIYTFVTEKFIESPDDYGIWPEPEKPIQEKQVTQLDLSDALKKKETPAVKREQKEDVIEREKENVVEPYKLEI